jgi:hypothetical protein
MKPNRIARQACTAPSGLRPSARAFSRPGKLALAALVVGALASSSANASGLDRDSLLTESPAGPKAGTVRVSAGANGQPTGAGDSGSTGGISGNVLWAPISRVAADVGLYAQGADSGPTIRLRIQILKQEDLGLDLCIGARFKEFGFFKKEGGGAPNGEFEYLLAVGHSFGPIDAMLDAVVGFEAGGPGSDIEGKAFVGYHLTRTLRVGADARVQGEYKNENGYKKPDLTNDVDLIAGPAASWLVLNDKLQLQALVGVAKPKGAANASPGGLLALAFDF